MADQSAILFWNRLVPEPQSNDVADALRSEIHDPLWLLARQWQLGEFKAADAGTAAFSHFITQTTPLQRLTSGQESFPLPADKPLNAVVERIDPAFDLSFRIESGRMWRKMLIKAGKQDVWDRFRQNPLFQFKIPPFTFDPEDSELRASYLEAYAQTLAAYGQGRGIDGGELYTELKNRKASAFLESNDETINTLGKQWRNRVRETLGLDQPASTSCWDATRLEYKATTVAALPNNDSAFLQAPEHNGQPMEWYAWEQTTALSPIEQTDLKKSLKPDITKTHRRTYIPTLVSFPGMPQARWWEMEDSTIDLSNVRANKTDTGLLLLTEFSLLFSNDWLLTPLTLPAGVLSRVKSLRVTDVFGVQSFINKSVNSAHDTNWGLFQLGPTLNGWLWLPPVNAVELQSQPMEEVMFIRDEMANMVWAVEKTVPDGLGGGLDGGSAAAGLEGWLRSLIKDIPDLPPVLPAIKADFKYTIGNTVPPHWIPFIPYRPDSTKPDIVLRRAAMPRIIEGLEGATRIRPRTQVLRNPTQNTSPYDVKEEEIPAMGLTIRTIWRRTRWINGQTVTWMAREKSLGRHLESSGLQFDIISNLT